MTAPSYFDVESSAPATVGTLTGNYLLTKTGSGVLLLSAANTFAGGAAISAGTLQLGNANSMQDSTVTVNANSGLAFNSGIGTFDLGGPAAAATSP